MMRRPYSRKRKYESVTRDEIWTTNKLPKGPGRSINIGENWHVRTCGGTVGGTTTPANILVSTICNTFAAALGTNFKIKSISVWTTVNEMKISFNRTELTNEVQTNNNLLSINDVAQNANDFARCRVHIPSQKQKLIPYSTTDTKILVQNDAAGGFLFWRAVIKFQS